MKFSRSAPTSLFFTLIILFGLFSCSKTTSISSLVKDKAHDGLGLYFIEYQKPQDPEKIHAELKNIGYNLKEGYYVDGLEKKTDQYKFVSFYGKEYINLKDKREEKKTIDSLLFKNDMSSFIEVLEKHPTHKIEKPEQKGLAFISSLEDAKLFTEHFGVANSKVEPVAQKLVTSAQDLLDYRNIFGASEYTEQTILKLLPSSNLEESKLLLNNFHDSKHLKKIEINYLGKTDDIKNFIVSDVQKKYFNISSNFNFENSSDVRNLAKAMNLFFEKEGINSPLPFSLFDEHVHRKTTPLHLVTKIKDINLVMSYVEKNANWLGEKYIVEKEKRLITDVHHSRYGDSQMFDLFYSEVLELLHRWEWKNNFIVSEDATFIETLKGAKRQTKKAKPNASALEDIFFQNIDNKNFKEISSLENLDQYSFIRFSGNYILNGDKKYQLPFHIVFELNEGQKNYTISEMIISENGAMKSWFNGKTFGNSIYYQSNTNKLMKKGKR